MILAGIDEAGYGPLLGPPVVSATAFELEGVVLPVDMEDVPCMWWLLREAVAKKSPAKKGRVLVADSKAVNALTDGTKLLERGVLAFLRCYAAANLDGAELTAGRLMEVFGCTNHELAAQPWYAPDHLV